MIAMIEGNRSTTRNVSPSLVSESILAAIRTYHEPGSLYTTGIYSSVLEAGMSKIKVPLG
jgi:hypothetical protein